MPNRARAPRTFPVRHIDFPVVQELRLDNGFPLLVLHSDTQEVTRVDVVFHAGRPYEQKNLVARATAAQIREGTRKHTSAEVAEHFDYYGSEFSAPFQLDTANLSLVALNKHLESVLPVFSEILHSPAFPEAELAHFIQRNQQKLLVDLSQNDVIAYRQITEMIFGSAHPYGYNSTPDMYAALTSADLQAHHQRTYSANNGVVFASGWVDEHAIRLLNDTLGQAVAGGVEATPLIPVSDSMPVRQRLHHPRSQQTAIRIGRRLFNRHHPDYHKMYVVNTLLGGYFGSRLMSSIREEKGYTYNIYSSLECMRFDGYFYIATETGNEVAEKALQQIYEEIAGMQEHLVSQKELNLAKNYLLGGMLSQIDGPFNTMDLVRSLTLESLDLSFFQEAVAAIREITPEEVRDLARKYLGRDQMWEILVGA
ncbi:MAG: M16 family metallopeptidase [Haliscomenobacter sp.]